MKDRREFLRALGITAAGLAAWRYAMAEDSTSSSYVAPVPTGGPAANVVVIGGGMAGVTVAKYLRVWGGQNLKVTLIEKDASYVSNIMSNLVLNGSRTISGLTYAYNALRTNYGVNVVRGEVVNVNGANRQVTYRSGTTDLYLTYDRLVVAPGIDFDLMNGLDAGDYDGAFPHAWKAGAQTTRLRNLLTAMPAGGHFVMTIPLAPYRCPPGPYERACVVADWLKRNKPGSKVIVLDENPGITAEVHSFTTAFNEVHKGVIEYWPDASRASTLGSTTPSFAPLAIDKAAMTVKSAAWGDFKGAVINPIPRQRAPLWMNRVGLIGPNDRWALVDPKTYARSDPALPGVHVIGDAANHGLPKAGHVANVEAKVCADAIVRSLNGVDADPSPMANSACFSPITATTASWLTAIYRYDATAVPPKMVMVNPPAAEGALITTDNFAEMGQWFNQLMKDSFA